MVVVIIISALAVIAVPSLRTRMRNARTLEATNRVTNLFRDARMRALGRGSAVMVRFSKATDSAGAFQVREAMQGAAVAGATCAPLPASSCTAPLWDDTDSTVINLFVPSNNQTFDALRVRMYRPYDGSGTATDDSDLDICYTPLGRSFWRLGAVGAWLPAGGLARASVYRHDTSNNPVGLTRWVFLPPNGAARIGGAG